MTTHEGHDHPNTKAGRAACRRAAGLIGDRKSANDLPKMSAEEKARVKAGKPKKAKPARRRIDEPINTSLPHEYEDDLEKPDRCFVCGLTPRARVHTDGPTDLAARFKF